MLRIEAERRMRNWSRAELARRASMSASTVGQIENGRLVPYSSQLTKIADALAIPANLAEALVEELSDGE